MIARIADTSCIIGFSIVKTCLLNIVAINIHLLQCFSAASNMKIRCRVLGRFALFRKMTTLRYRLQLCLANIKVFRRQSQSVSHFLAFVPSTKNADRNRFTVDEILLNESGRVFKCDAFSMSLPSSPEAFVSCSNAVAISSDDTFILLSIDQIFALEERLLYFCLLLCLIQLMGLCIFQCFWP